MTWIHREHYRERGLELKEDPVEYFVEVVN
jgi:hypothetical protein